SVQTSGERRGSLSTSPSRRLDDALRRGSTAGDREGGRYRGIPRNDRGGSQCADIPAYASPITRRPREEKTRHCAALSDMGPPQTDVFFTCANASPLMSFSTVTAPTGAALALGAFAVFNQIVRGDTIFNGAPQVVQETVVVQQPAVVYAPPPPPPAVVFAPPPAVVYGPPPVIYAPAPPPAVYYVPAPTPVYAYPYAYYPHYRAAYRWGSSGSCKLEGATLTRASNSGP